MKANPSGKTGQWSRLALVVALVAVALPGNIRGDEIRETFEANAIAMGTSNPPVVRPGTTATLQITINRWTTAEERNHLLGQLMEGQELLVKGLRSQEETGFIRATSVRTASPSERLRYAWQHVNEDGSRRIVAALDRPITLYESINRPRWRDYDVTLIILDVDAEGNGDGQLAVGVQMELTEDGQLTIENFGTEPVRLTRVRQR